MKIIKLTEEQLKMLETPKNELETARIAFRTATQLIRLATDEIWNRVHEMFPEEGNNYEEILWDSKEVIFKEKD